MSPASRNPWAMSPRWIPPSRVEGNRTSRNTLYPHRPGPFPAIVFLHGGGGSSGALSYDAGARGLAKGQAVVISGQLPAGTRTDSQPPSMMHSRPTDGQRAPWADGEAIRVAWH
jgi:pimeloyl-ACP methyl ester carboxylesterase